MKVRRIWQWLTRWRTNRHECFTPQYWDRVLEQFPRAFAGSPSTNLYRMLEERLIRRYLPLSSNPLILKLDLWNEARNTRLLERLLMMGYRCIGLDISVRIAKLAYRYLQKRMPTPLLLVANAEQLPFRANSIPAIYTMGTLEHLRSVENALAEIQRVLQPGGRAIIGVPYRFDPFGFMIASTLLQWLGLYPYGRERFYSRRQLRKMIQQAGLRCVFEDGIMFLPWFLRWLDLLVWTRWPRMIRLVRPFVRMFAPLNLQGPAWVRRMGYLTVVIAEKPPDP